MQQPQQNSEKEKSGIRRSLVLAGGGVRLAYHSGVLMALKEEGLTFNHVDGTSGGIFGTAMMASGISPEEIGLRWRKLKLKGFISALPLKNYRSGYTLSALGGTDGIRNKIFPQLGIDVNKINSQKGFDATFNVCNFSEKTIESIPHTQVTLDHLVAGMSLPIFMPAIKIKEDWYTDAVWIKDANLTEAVKRGAEEIWLIWCIGNTPEYHNGFFNQYVHMIEISANGALSAEIEWLEEVNLSRINSGLKPVHLHIIKPEYPLPLDPDYFLDRINADTLINWGYEDAKSYLKTRSDAATRTDPVRATAMKTPGDTLHFRQQFGGKSLANNASEKIIISLSFFVRKAENEIAIQQFSSISLSGNQVISGFQNMLIKQGRGKFTSLFQFNYNNATCQARLEFHIKNIHDFSLGIEVKSAKVSFTPPGIFSVEKVFYQSAKVRLKNAIHMNIKAEAGWFRKMKLKYELLEVFISN